MESFTIYFYTYSNIKMINNIVQRSTEHLIINDTPDAVYTMIILVVLLLGSVIYGLIKFRRKK